MSSVWLSPWMFAPLTPWGLALDFSRCFVLGSVALLNFKPNPFSTQLCFTVTATAALAGSHLGEGEVGVGAGAGVGMKTE